jgi:hypothetical protein
MKPKIIGHACTVLLLCGALGACLNSGDSDSDKKSDGDADESTTTATGYFLDSAVAGLSYTSGAQSGLTNESGKFTYEVGQTVTFKLGGVTLGSANGSDTVTPIDLVADGTAANTAVLNIVRFLMLLDDNNDPADGINIVEAVRTKAASWPAVDFASTSFDSNIAPIISDAMAINSTATLPTSKDASAHLRSTYYCAASGGYQGDFTATTGSGNGTWKLVIDPLNGVIEGRGHENTQNSDFDISGLLKADATKSFAVGSAGTASFTGTIGTGGAITGTWVGGGGSDTGTFKGSKVAVALPAGAAGTQFNGAFTGDGLGIFTLAIAADGSIVGTGYDGTSNFSITGAVNLNNGMVTLGNTSNGASFSGELSDDGKTMSGYWSTMDASGDFSACAPAAGFAW